MTDAEFDALIESAYAEPITITGELGDDDLTQVAPAPPRRGVDLGVAGSLVQARDRVRSERREVGGRYWRRPTSIAAAAVLVACLIAQGVLIARYALPGRGGLPSLAIGLLLAVAGGAVWMLWQRHGPSPGERRLSRTIAAEQRAGRELATALTGSPWVLLHDRRLPNTEHRVPFLAVGPAGIAVIAVFPAGPYLTMPVGVRAGEDELTSAWLPARIWEAKYLMRQLITVAARDLRFTGPIMPMAVEGYMRATKIPEGWSAQPPYRIDQYQIRSPTTLGQYLQYLPALFAPRHVAQLIQLVDQQCEPMPSRDSGQR